jgi:hypothetical protein
MRLKRLMLIVTTLLLIPCGCNKPIHEANDRSAPVLPAQTNADTFSV